MGENQDDRIDILRKRSRLLLAQINENSKKVKNEIKKLCSRNLELGGNSKNYVGGTRSFQKGNIKSWTIRNNSSGVDGVLHSDYFFNSPGRKTPASMPNISNTKRILTSKRQSEDQPCSKNINREPVKGCYCSFESKKNQLKLTRTKHTRHSPCKRCKSHVIVPAIVIEESLDKPVLNSPISCKTLRRIQKVDYAPESQFLRNARSRVSLLQAGDCPQTCYKSQSCQELMRKKTTYNTDDNQFEKLEALAKPVHVRSGTNEEYLDSEAKNIRRKFNKGVQVSLKKHSNPTVVTKRILSSKTFVPDAKKAKSSTKLKTVSSPECQCCQKSRLKIQTERENYVDTEDIVCVNELPSETSTEKEYLCDKELRELKKFRQQNYFDTHGSNQTLISSKSSGSLEQYLLNDRLFAEPVRTVHKKDLVVTVPACATVQRKRIHYFPRYIVRQEKCNANQKKKRCQTCPLIGHAIDLGVTKIRPPLNSLALKYQKRLP